MRERMSTGRWTPLIPLQEETRSLVLEIVAQQLQKAKADNRNLHDAAGAITAALVEAAGTICVKCEVELDVLHQMVADLAVIQTGMAYGRVN